MSTTSIKKKYPKTRLTFKNGVIKGAREETVVKKIYRKVNVVKIFRQDITSTLRLSKNRYVTLVVDDSVLSDSIKITGKWDEASTTNSRIALVEKNTGELTFIPRSDIKRIHAIKHVFKIR